MALSFTLPNAEQADTLNSKLDAQNAILAMMAGKMGAYDEPASWGALQTAVRNGTIGQILQPGDQVEVANREGSSTVDYDVLGIDEDCPVNSALSHTLTIQQHAINNVYITDPRQYLYVVTADVWPNGMPAGTYTITLKNAGPSGDLTLPDGTYQMTTTKTIPVGGGIRHAILKENNGTTSETGVGIGDLNTSTTPDVITTGVWITYDSDTVTVLENLTCSLGTGGTSLGTTTNSDPSFKIGACMNFAPRQQFGTNRFSKTMLFQWLNSDDALYSWTPPTIWSRKDTRYDGTIPGFLYSLDPDLRKSLVKVRKKLMVPTCDGGGYELVEGYAFLLLETELNGQAKGDVYEGGSDENGVRVHDGPYSYWAGASYDDRVKYLSSTGEAMIWTLGTATNSEYSASQRMVQKNGTLNTVRPRTGEGIVPVLCIG